VTDAASDSANPLDNPGATQTGRYALAEFRRGERVAGRYRMERVLGIGGMGVVYLAHDEQLDVPVALKVLRPELATRPNAFERFRQELLLARQVSSPHVVRIHDLAQHEHLWLISMDYVEGRSLEAELESSGRLAPGRAAEIVRQLALGLAAAHEQGVVHRDLKPANVLIGSDGRARITDFGVARSVGATGLTASGVIVGTPDYLSPEQARGDPIDPRSDLYTLGLMLYEMVSGVLPFRGGTPAELIAQRLVRAPDPLASTCPDAPPWLARLADRLLDPRPARRLQQATEVVRAIEQRQVARAPVDPRVGIPVLALLLLLALALVGWQRDWFGRPPVAAGARVVAQVEPLALAVLPFRAPAGDEARRALARGIPQRLGSALAIEPGARVGDLERSERMLADLGFDPDNQDEHLAEIARGLPARRLLGGRLEPEADLTALVLEVRTPDSTQPAWRFRTPAFDDAGGATALAEAERALRQYLGLPAGATAWPSVSALRAAGGLQPSRAESVAALVAAARADASGDLWWPSLRALEFRGESAEAAALARAAIDALAERDDATAERTRAYAEVLLGEPDAARGRAQALLARAPEDLALALLAARAEAESGHLEAAIGRLRGIVVRDPRDVEAWYQLGRALLMAGDARQAVDEALTRALVLATRLDDPRMQADVPNALGLGYRQLGRLAPAAAQFELAAESRAALGDVRGQAVSLRNLATVHSILGRFDRAREALDHARTLLAPLGDAAAMADLANNLGVLEEERGDYRQALAAYREALAHFQQSGDARALGETLNNVAFAYYQVGEFEHAQVYWTQAATTYAGIDDRAGSVRADQGRALAELARGDFASARNLLERTLVVAEQLQLVDERGAGLLGLAELDRIEGDWRTGTTRAAQALDQFRKRADPRGTAESLLVAGALALESGDLESARPTLAELARSVPSNREQRALGGLRSAELAQSDGDATAALRAVDAAIADAAGSHSLATELAARLARTAVLADLERADEARAELARARSALQGYASVPLRLMLFEVALRVDAGRSQGDYREARALLARLPRYGRTYRIHAWAARAFSSRGDRVAAAEAARSAAAAYAAVVPGVPDAARQVFEAQARALGVATEQEP